MRTDNRKTGDMAENAVAEELEKRGFLILDRNYYSRFGELDIVAKKGEAIAFIEVKYRKNNNFGTPAEAVTLSKQKKLIKTAEIYLAEKGLSDLLGRFDVAEVCGENMEIRIIEGAFDLTGAGFWEDNF